MGSALWACPFMLGAPLDESGTAVNGVEPFEVGWAAAWTREWTSGEALLSRMMSGLKLDMDCWIRRFEGLLLLRESDGRSRTFRSSMGMGLDGGVENVSCSAPGENMVRRWTRTKERRSLGQRAKCKGKVGHQVDD